MSTATETERFAQARQSERTLNSRQRQVLDLLVAGKTNGEIGAILGITLDGAKWNVSEILGKLGLESREEAAEYWRGRSSPGRRFAALRGMVGLGSLKWVAGSAALVVGGVFVLSLFARDDETEAAGLPPFYLEARIEIDDRSRTIGTNIAGTPGATEHRTSQLHWWQKDPDHTRWEIENDQGFVTERSVLVADGKDQWYYREEVGTYTKQPLQELPDGFRIRPIGISLLIGPGYVGDAQEYLDSLKGWGGPDATIAKVGTEVVLGRDTTIYEFTPATRSTQGRPDANGNIVETETGSGTMRIWLDEERVVVMRYVSTSETADIRAEVTLLNYNTHIEDSRFRFEVPPGAILHDDSDDGTTSIGTGASGQRGMLVGYDVPPGFFEVGGSAGEFLPYAWKREEGATGNVISFELQLAKDTGPAEIAVVQRRAPAGLPPSLRQGQEMTVGGVSAWRFELNGSIRVTTLRDGIALTITGVGATEEEVLAVVGSLEPVP